MGQLTTFDRKYMQAFQELAEVTKAKKELDAREAEIKEELTKGMESFGLVSIDNDYVKISYIKPSVSTSFDTKAFKLDDPDKYNELFEKYNKQTERKGYVKVSVK